MNEGKYTELHVPCPVCTSSDAYCVYADGHGYCFSCQYFKPPNEEFINLSEEFTYEYLPWRGVSQDTFRLYSCQTKIDADGKPVEIGFPYPSGAFKVRDLKNKEFRWSGNSVPGLFGLDRFAHGAYKSITITEGELDACSLYQVLRSPVVSVQSAASAVRDCAAARSELGSYERIYLAFDNDPKGREALAAVAKLFDYNKVFHVKFTNRKDANEYLQHNEGDELRNLHSNARRYLPETIVSSFSEFEKILSEPKKYGVPYPFPTLNKMTYGIRTGECVLIKAPEKVGKTALMHAIEHHYLKETTHNVAAIFNEEPQKRHLESIGGLELRKPVHLPDCGVSEGEILAAVQKVVGVDDRLHLHRHYGSDSPDSLLDLIRFLVVARDCKLVLLDNISMVISGLAGESDERRAFDYLSTQLEMMAKELDFALIMVSHVNDFGQTRGSRYLTKVSDITISAARNTEALDDKEKRTIHLSIPYNRFCSSTGAAGNLLFDPATYTLTEDHELWLPTSSLPDQGTASRKIVTA